MIHLLIAIIVMASAAWLLVIALMPLAVALQATLQVKAIRTILKKIFTFSLVVLLMPIGILYLLYKHNNDLGLFVKESYKAVKIALTVK